MEAGGRAPGTRKVGARYYARPPSSCCATCRSFIIDGNPAISLSTNLQRLTAAMHRLRENRRSESESLEPILRRLTEIERHLRLTETPQAPQPSRRHPMGA
jgi:hypothetical protein